jgi:bifunctional DNA-binding transcriptional regulator/antitoxin component of YhaV-PrlF toxin-antitoxin module
MPANLDVESTLTDRYQTTVPETVRRALRLGKRDKIHYSIRPNGEVVLSRVEIIHDDPAIGSFLNLLEADIRQRQASRRLCQTILHWPCWQHCTGTPTFPQILKATWRCDAAPAGGRCCFTNA